MPDADVTIAFLAISELRVFPVVLVLEELHCGHFLRSFMISNWAVSYTHLTLPPLYSV